MADPLRGLGLSPAADDYGRAPPTRWTQPLSARAVTGLTALGALVVGFLLTAGIAVGRTEADAIDERKEGLIAVIRDRQDHVTELERELEQLRGQVAEVEAHSGPRAGALQRTVARVEEAAGLLGISGPGVRVTMDDARSSCRGAQPQDCRIQDADLQLAVNALFAAGAEAVAVGGERVIATTAIRGAGGSVLVNYRVLAPPYVVEAIGDPDGLLARFGESELAADFAAWTEVFGLGFSVEAVEELALPPYGGGLRLEHAVIAETVGVAEDEDVP
jgi:uncharacterized protein YlxW (UPF0749 family)